MSLQQLFAKNIEDVLVPNESVNRDALLQLKQSLDPVAGKYSPMGAIHVNGLKSDQVWVQAQMILEGVTEKLNEKIAEYKGDASDDDSAESDSNPEALSEEDLSQEDLSEEDPNEEGVEESEEEIDPNMHDDYVESDYATAEEPEEEHRRSAKPDSEEEEEESEEEPTSGPKKDNFDLAEFQQHVLQLENDDDDEEDVDIDWNADVPESESEDEDMHFKDFFAAPQPKKAKKEKRIEKVDDEDNDNESDEGMEDQEEDVMETTRRDLFSDEDEDEDEDEDNDNEGTRTKSQPMSKFERQQQELAEQIDQLENENIGEKEWGMKGEAQAKDRPSESLFNIQFERNVKAAPVITEESTVSIEDLIKERIRKQQFDDIPRRSELSAPHLRKELPELSDQKSQKSLAELYESDQMREQTPDYYAKQDSQVMDAAHQEVVDMFTSVSRKLDALCSWQYTPRPAAPSLNITTDTPSIAMEEAQPGTMSLESQQAPQEVYRSESAVPMANQEMTTSMKRKRRRDKAKAHAERATAKESANKRSGKKEEMFNTLKRGNVTMVDKRGQKRDMRGNAVKETQQNASNIKL